FFLQFFFECYDDHQDLHSFPTRRSSDLRGDAGRDVGAASGAPLEQLVDVATTIRRGGEEDASGGSFGGIIVVLRLEGEALRAARSEEHTSELQSRENLVCRLLLEKKK